jgi:hypothetical protein
VGILAGDGKDDSVKTSSDVSENCLFEEMNDIKTLWP